MLSCGVIIVSPGVLAGVERGATMPPGVTSGALPPGVAGEIGCGLGAAGVGGAGNVRVLDGWALGAAGEAGAEAACPCASAVTVNAANEAASEIVCSAAIEISWTSLVTRHTA